MDNFIYAKSVNSQADSLFFRRLLSALISLLLVFSGFYFQNGYFGIIASFLTIFLIDKKEYLIPPLFVSALLSESCFVFNNITGMRFFSLLFIVLSVLDAKKFDLKIFMYLLCLALYLSLSAFLSFAGFTSNTLSMLINILLLLFFSNLSLKDLPFIVSILFISFAAIVLCSYLSYFNGAILHDNGSFELLRGTNNNDFAMSLVLVVAFFSSIIYVTKTKIFKAITIFLACLASFAIVLLGSRSALFGAASAMFACYICYIKQSKKKALFIFVSASLIVTLSFFIFNSDFLTSSLMQRFTLANIIETNGTSRFDIWSCVYEKCIKKYPLFGVGFGGENISAILYSNGIFHSGTHNIILDILAQIGIFGLVYFSVGIAYIIIRLKGCVKTPIRLFPLFALIGFLANGIGENIYQERFLWMTLAFAICLVKTHSQKSDCSMMVKEGKL